MEYDTIYFDQFYLKCKDIVNLLEEGTETKGTFEKLVLILYEGLLHRDALILFMLGLYELNKKEVISKSFEEVWNNTFPKEMPSARDLLIQSAEVGLDQAKLWCAYCYSEGIFGFPQNYSQSDMLLNKIENRPFDDDIDYLRWLNDECKRTATIWDSSGREKTSDTYNSLHEISQQLSEFVSYCCEIPNGYGWSYYEWISKMNLYESCFDTEYAPPAILEREQNKEQADMLCADGKNAYKKKEYVKAKAFFLEAISYDKENPISA